MRTTASLTVKRNIFERISDRFTGAGQRLVEGAADEVIRAARPRTPVDTGELVGSSYVEIDGYTGMVGWRAKHAPFQNNGTSRGIVGKHFAEHGAKAGARFIRDNGGRIEGEL